MRAVAHSTSSDRSRHLHHVRRLARGSAYLSGRPGAALDQRSAAPTPTVAAPPAATDAWWLTRSAEPSFGRRTVTLPEACVHALSLEAAPAPVLVEFNGARFEGATVALRDGRYELNLGEALTQAMAEVLDEDDGLEIEPLPGHGRPAVAIHPYVNAE